MHHICDLGIVNPKLRTQYALLVKLAKKVESKNMFCATESHVILLCFWKEIKMNFCILK